jgi:hypothetical protein
MQSTNNKHLFYLKKKNSPLSELSYNLARTHTHTEVADFAASHPVENNRMQIHNNVCVRLQSLECKFIAKLTRRYDNSTICAHTWDSM